MLIFKYGTMGSGKTIECLTKIYYERSKGNKVIVSKSSIDTRDPGIIKSRAGLEINIDCSILDILLKDPLSYDNKYIIIDEAQFLTKGRVQLLREIANLNTTIICYGLKTDFLGNLFPGSQTLLELSDEIIEISSTCKLCNNKAMFNMRVIDGKPVFTGEVIKSGGDSLYIAVCSSCYYKAKGKEGEEKS